MTALRECELAAASAATARLRVINDRGSRNSLFPQENTHCGPLPGGAGAPARARHINIFYQSGTERCLCPYACTARRPVAGALLPLPPPSYAVPRRIQVTGRNATSWMWFHYCLTLKIEIQYRMEVKLAWVNTRGGHGRARTAKVTADVNGRHQFTVILQLKLFD
ncbi:hypothetical protein EVAR_44834_1 [Eumeta japonica]|uniref:Uncharacterized protein n=1 Tax=Eumeta variegata TaxID=151549 RepID=A0A4C1YMD1_EUMVA|nr:hypothetical protein EVAR_44834_1 [Eumeta japonica]